MEDSKIEVYNNGKLLFEIIGIKDALKFTHDKEEIEIVVFETSTGDDFVKIKAEKTMLGIFAECAWANHTYPGFEKGNQSLLHLEINDMVFPCDLINFKNDETGEERNIFFDISEFYGKDLF